MMDPSKGTSKGEAQPPLNLAASGAISTGDALKLFLLAGQSNMKGRATIPMKPEENRNIIFFHSRERKWYIARDPLHAQGVPDLIDGDDNSGTGPGMTFARCLADQDPTIKIGLIPAAVGGAPIDSFGVGEKLYDRSLMLATQAAASSQVQSSVEAILWLQGESDAIEGRYESYEVKLLDLIDRYRADMDNRQLPFIACTIGSFVRKGHFQYAEKINDVLLGLPDKRPHTHCVDARDMTGHIGDGMHYDIESQVEIGKRFAEAYLGLLETSSASKELEE